MGNLWLDNFGRFQADPTFDGHTYTILGKYGNMSSASALFVLERFLAHHRPTGDYGVMLARGPGFSAEKVLFRW